MIINIQDTKIDTADITKLYPVAIIGTGYEDETTHISLEWLESEGQGKVVVAGYAIVVHLGNEERKEFFYPTKDDLDKGIAHLQNQLNSK